MKWAEAVEKRTVRLANTERDRIVRRGRVGLGDDERAQQTYEAPVVGEFPGLAGARCRSANLLTTPDSGPARCVRPRRPHERDHRTTL